jgi:hypothetical protein
MNLPAGIENLNIQLLLPDSCFHIHIDVIGLFDIQIVFLPGNNRVFA